MAGQKNNDEDGLNLSRLIEKHGNKIGIPAAFLAYGSLRGLADIVLADGITKDAIMPVVAAYISSCVGHQLTPSKYVRFLATSIGPVMAGYEFAGYLSSGLEWLISGTQEYIAKPLDHPGETVKNAAKSAYNKFNELIGRPFDEAKVTKTREQGILESGLESAKDYLKYVHFAGTVVAAYYLKKLSKPVREQMLRRWETPKTKLERLGEFLGLRKKRKDNE